MIHLLFAALLLSPVRLQQVTPTQAETDLGRVFTKGEKLSYQFRSTLNLEMRSGNLQTWIPEDHDINYDFSFQVSDLKGDGVAVLHYLRPTMTEIEGETVNSAPIPKVEKVNLDYQLNVSPSNEIIDIKDLSQKKPVKKGGGNLFVLRRSPEARQGLRGFVSQFVGEIYRLSLFVGGVDSGLDFAPKMPFEPAKIGETWKRTVGFTPQKLRGKEGKMEMQRIDYTYTFKGLVDSDNKKVFRVEATTSINSDLAQYVFQVFNMKAEDTDLKKALLTMQAKIEFDLDPKTRHTLQARAKSTAGFSVILDKMEQPYEEVKMKGSSTLTLAKREIVPEPKKKG